MFIFARFSYFADKHSTTFETMYRDRQAADTQASVMAVYMGVCIALCIALLWKKHTCMSFSTIKHASCLIGLHDQERVQRVCTRVLKKHNV